MTGSAPSDRLDHFTLPAVRPPTRWRSISATTALDYSAVVPPSMTSSLPVT
jgi:hypothetical protein